MSYTSSNSKIIGRYRIPGSIPEAACHCFRSLTIHWDGSRRLGFVDPMPSQADLNAFYRTQYRHIMNKKRSVQCYLTSPNYRAQVRSQVSWVAPFLGSEGRWLDIGAGFGLLLPEVKRSFPGWELHAVEGDSKGHEALRGVAKVVQEPDDFWSGGPAHDLYDVVSLSHVLEHLPRVDEAIRHVMQKISPGGMLLLEVPNDHREELCRHGRSSDLPHLWFFSHPGLIDFIRASGFEILKSAEIGLRKPGQPVGYMRRAVRSMKVRLRGSMALIEDPDWYAEGKNRTDIRVVARRPA